MRASQQECETASKEDREVSSRRVMEAQDLNPFKRVHVVTRSGRLVKDVVKKRNAYELGRYG